MKFSWRLGHGFDFGVITIISNLWVSITGFSTFTVLTSCDIACMISTSDLTHSHDELDRKLMSLKVFLCCATLKTYRSAWLMPYGTIPVSLSTSQRWVFSVWLLPSCNRCRPMWVYLQLWRSLWAIKVVLLQTTVSFPPLFLNIRIYKPMDDLKNDRRIMASDRLLDHVIVRHERFRNWSAWFWKWGRYRRNFVSTR